MNYFDCEKKLLKHLIDVHGFEDASDQDHPFRAKKNGVGICCFTAVSKRVSVEDILARVRRRAAEDLNDQ